MFMLLIRILKNTSFVDNKFYFKIDMSGEHNILHNTLASSYASLQGNAIR